MGLVDALIVAVFAVFYRPVLYVAFDRGFAASQNMPVRAIGYAMSALVAVTIVMSIRVVGIVLLISLLTIPAVIATQIAKSFGRILLLASAIATLGAFAGLWISYRSDIPSGASTIFVLTVTLIVVKLLPLRTPKR